MKEFAWMLLMMLVVVVRAEEQERRTQKALSIFTVVKFPNTACSSATTGRNGTCYTTSECQAKGGSSSGSCASSFGVCCVFEKSCQGGRIAGEPIFNIIVWPSHCIPYLLSLWRVKLSVKYSKPENTTAVRKTLLKGNFNVGDGFPPMPQSVLITQCSFQGEESSTIFSGNAWYTL